MKKTPKGVGRDLENSLRRGSVLATEGKRKLGAPLGKESSLWGESVTFTGEIKDKSEGGILTRICEKSHKIARSGENVPILRGSPKRTTRPSQKKRGFDRLLRMKGGSVFEGVLLEKKKRPAMGVGPELAASEKARALENGEGAEGEVHPSTNLSFNNRGCGS